MSNEHDSAEVIHRTEKEMQTHRLREGHEHDSEIIHRTEKEVQTHRLREGQRSSTEQRSQYSPSELIRKNSYHNKIEYAY